MRGKIKRADWEEEWNEKLSWWLNFCRFSKPRKKVHAIIELGKELKTRKLKSWNVDKEYVRIIEATKENRNCTIEIPFKNIVSCEYKN